MWLSDFRIVLPDRVIERGSVCIEDGFIRDIAERPISDAALTGNGLILLPGFIDMHGDMIEREIEPRPNVNMPMELGLRDLDRKLAGSGITTAYAALSFSPASTYGHLRSYEHTSAVIRALYAMKDRLLVDHRIHARFEITFPKALEVIDELIREGTVDLISLTDHTPGQGQYRDIERVAQRMAAEKGVTREEAAALVARKIEERTRPAEELAATLARISKTCHAHNVHLASHDDDTVAKVEIMAQLGVTISEFPVTEEAARAAHDYGLFNAMGAPNAMRGQSYSGNLSAREAHRQGLLDILAADYHPSAILPAVLELAKIDPEGLTGAARLSAANAAHALGLDDRGTIEIGKHADLVVADDTGIGHVVATLRNGRTIFSDGRLLLSRERMAPVHAD
ncbi:alpha-D-ribose 1-methylphosphonate 5-triphosphate diphosphatase [Aquamicrobium sp. LC103]|uniref:alpha-D-ribose 1-methylphosphonate 5-triphosphate diphosphatase n=1 Tax=Aquamicrobium sp. LC103 TaxID=1120658 RepID=UPI00063EA74F|nr:alpha-D-ribose 1-methylphosphonate 5-triphosphate diphosphatase [Aquamicrobium sp. LC103]TKT69853.1 alpha-D-ribose 1-methylphosphonate 5-triphosphate diphosphatase [Aquamicrobium sp. LC103]